MELVNDLQAADAATGGGRGSGAGGAANCCARWCCCWRRLRPFLRRSYGRNWAKKASVLRAPWPVSDPDLAKEDELEIPVQINGKLVTVVRVAADAAPKSIEAAALADEKVQSRASGKTVVKVIVVPGKLVNLVVK